MKAQPNVVWQKRTSPDFRLALGDGHENIVVYSNDESLFRKGINLLPLNDKQKEEYKNPDSDPKGPWVSRDFTAQGFRPNQMYKIVTPGGAAYYPPEGKCWKTVEEVFLEQLNEGRFWFGEDRRSIPRRKNYLSEAKGRQSWTWWPNAEVGHTQEAKREVNEILGSSEAFDTPKPVRLVQRILTIATGSGDIVLDSFAGSGTTAHAMLALNREDGGNRKFILIECEDYADSITAERVRRVIRGVPKAKDAALRDGLGGSFAYCTLGEPLDAEAMLTGETLPDRATLAAWLLHTATGISAGPGDFALENNDDLFYRAGDTDYYLIYKPREDWLSSHDAMLGEARARHIHAVNREERRKAVVFGPGKYMSQRDLTAMGITFCQLPFELYRAGGG